MSNPHDSSDQRTIRVPRLKQHIEHLHASGQITSSKRYELRQAVNDLGTLDVTPNDLRRILAARAKSALNLFEQFFVPQEAVPAA